MTEHSARAHTLWSMSANARNIQCAGAIAMSSLCEDVEREAAAWGTACHEVAEMCLSSAVNAKYYFGTVRKVGKFTFTVDEEMANTAQVYIDYCRDRLAQYNEETGDIAHFWIEKKLSLASLDPPIEAGGTGDFIIWFPIWELLEIVDLKGGQGVAVKAKGNQQGRGYALAALLTLPNTRPKAIRVTIVQPRSGDGLPQSEEFHVADLLDWAHDLIKAMWSAKFALEQFETAKGNTVLFDEWAEAWLRPGQCTFCSAKAICPAPRKQALAAMPEVARRWHEDTTLETPPVFANQARLGTPEELTHDLDGFDELEAWIKARRAYAHAEAERGVTIPNYGLVDKIGNRTWLKDIGPAKIQNDLNLSPTQVFNNPEMRSVAQIEKILGKRKTELAKLEGVLWEKPVRGTNLVRLDKTTRPAAKSTVERFHEEMEN